MAHLTDLTIRRAKAARKPYTFKDRGGLYLNINSNGTKNWLFRFYWQGRQKRISFGTYPTVDLKKARSLRQQAHDLLANGIDPRTYRTSQSTPAQPNRAAHPPATPQPPQPETIGIRFADYAEPPLPCSAFPSGCSGHSRNTQHALHLPTLPPLAPL